MQLESFAATYSRHQFCLQTLLHRSSHPSPPQIQKSSTEVSHNLSSPGPELRKFIIGFGKSILFVASTLFLIRRCLCLYTKYVKFSNGNCNYIQYQQCTLGF